MLNCRSVLVVYGHLDNMKSSSHEHEILFSLFVLFLLISSIRKVLRLYLDLHLRLLLTIQVDLNCFDFCNTFLLSEYEIPKRA